MNDILNLEKSVSSRSENFPVNFWFAVRNKVVITYIVSSALYNKKYSMNGGNSNGI